MRLIIYITLPLTGLILGWSIRWLYARFQLSSSEQRAERIKQDAVKEAEARKKELFLEAKDQVLKERNQHEKEFRERRSELTALSREEYSKKRIILTISSARLKSSSRLSQTVREI